MSVMGRPHRRPTSAGGELRRGPRCYGSDDTLNVPLRRTLRSRELSLRFLISSDCKTSERFDAAAHSKSAVEDYPPSSAHVMVVAYRTNLALRYQHLRRVNVLQAHPQGTPGGRQR